MYRKFLSVVFQNILNFRRTYIANITTPIFSEPNTLANWFERISKPRENKSLLQWWIHFVQDLWSFLWLFMVDECLTSVEITKMPFLLFLVFDFWTPCFLKSVARALITTDFNFQLGCSTLFDWVNLFSHSAEV